MKDFLKNLLIILSLCLCGLVAFQWHREAKLRLRLESSFEDVHGKTETIKNLQRNLGTAEAEVKRLDALRSGIAATAESNRLEIAALKEQLEQAGQEMKKTLKLTESYKSALQQANNNVERQNEQLKKLLDERNGAAVKFNKLVEDYNNLVKKWNEQQKELSFTNSLPTK